MNDTGQNPETRIALFQRKEVRRTIHNNEWWFVVEDVVLALIESRDPKQYIQRMKQRDPELGKGWVQIVHTLSIPTDGGPQPMLCSNTEGLFRIIQIWKRVLRKLPPPPVREPPARNSPFAPAVARACSTSDHTPCRSIRRRPGGRPTWQLS